MKTISAPKKTLTASGRLILLLLLLAALALAVPFGASAAEAVEYDCAKPELKAGELAVNANGQWVKFDDAKPYSVTEKVSEKDVTTYYVPLEAVAETLGCTVNGAEVAYNGLTAALETTEKNGAAYVELTAWAKGFDKLGAKTMTDGNYLYISIKTDAAYTLEAGGNTYAFAAAGYSDAKAAFSYRAAKVNSDLEGQGALVVFLHGGSYRGNDNALQLKLTPCRAFLDYLSGAGMKADLIVPQCPGNIKGWDAMTRTMAGMIKQYVADNDIDPDRVYIAGCSMGGKGVWAMLRDYSELFAAAMPVSSATATLPVPASADIITVPVYYAFGGQDNLGIEPYEKSVEMKDAAKQWVLDFRADGGVVKFDIVSNFSHMESCEYAFAPGALTWLFSHTRGEAAENAKYDYVKPELEKDELGLNVNGGWVEFDAEKPYAVTETVNEKKATTYFTPVEDVVGALGGCLEKTDDGWKVYYLALSASVKAGSDEIVVNDGSPNSFMDATLSAPAAEKNGNLYVPLDFWTKAFAEIGAKTMTDEAYLYISVKNDLSLDMDIAGKTYTFTSGAYENPDGYIPYREAKVNQNYDGMSTLVVFLHGGSYRGSDNISQLKLTPCRTLCEYFTENNMKAVVLVPQCTTATGGWVAEAGVIGAWLRDYIAKNNIDADKVYISGCSMGSQGTWGVLKECQDIFAAAMPISGEPQSDSGAVWVDPEEIYIPLYMAVGELDRAYMRDNMSEWAEAYAERGGTVECDVVEGYDHKTSCELSMTPERLDWLFSFTKGEGVVRGPVTFAEIAGFLRHPVMAVDVKLAK